jgi:peptidoglycan hydrolase CwlO-like protein
MSFMKAKPDRLGIMNHSILSANILKDENIALQQQLQYSQKEITRLKKEIVKLQAACKKKDRYIKQQTKQKNKLLKKMAALKNTIELLHKRHRFLRC